MVMYSIRYVQGHVQVYDAKGKFLFSADIAQTVVIKSDFDIAAARFVFAVRAPRVFTHGARQNRKCPNQPDGGNDSDRSGKR